MCERVVVFYRALLASLGLLTPLTLAAVDAIDLCVLEVEAGVGHLANAFVDIERMRCDSDPGRLQTDERVNWAGALRRRMDEQQAAVATRRECLHKIM